MLRGWMRSWKHWFIKENTQFLDILLYGCGDTAKFDTWLHAHGYMARCTGMHRYSHVDTWLFDIGTWPCAHGHGPDDHVIHEPVLLPWRIMLVFFRRKKSKPFEFNMKKPGWVSVPVESDSLDKTPLEN
jgi:hypothetical protein